MHLVLFGIAALPDHDPATPSISTPPIPILLLPHSSVFPPQGNPTPPIPRQPSVTPPVLPQPLTLKKHAAPSLNKPQTLKAKKSRPDMPRSKSPKPRSRSPKPHKPTPRKPSTPHAALKNNPPQPEQSARDTSDTTQAAPIIPEPSGTTQHITTPIPGTLPISKTQHNEAKAAARRASQTAYMQTVYRLLARYKRYPRLAQRRGEQGTVHIQFRIQADGRIEAIRLHTRSKSPRLDQAALQTVRRLNGVLPPLPTALGQQTWAVQVPITYRLRSVKTTNQH